MQGIKKKNEPDRPEGPIALSVLCLCDNGEMGGIKVSLNTIFAGPGFWASFGYE